jgi:hypothetical protein
VFLAIERDGAGGKAPRCVTSCLRTLINMNRGVTCREGGMLKVRTNLAQIAALKQRLLYVPALLLFSNSVLRPPLWSSGQSSWLQIRRPGFDSRHYQKKNVVGLERGPLILVSTTEELLDRKVAAPV